MTSGSIREGFPRPLLASERDALEFVLRHSSFPEQSELLAQAGVTTATDQCSCGCASIGLSVPHELAPASSDSESGVSTPIQNEAVVVNDAGEPIGGVLVFTKDGYLSYLEVYNYGDDPINPFPPVTHLQADVSVRDA